jgi:hypothetical protein
MTGLLRGDWNGMFTAEIDQKAQLFSMLQRRRVTFAFDFGFFWAERSNHP